MNVLLRQILCGGIIIPLGADLIRSVALGRDGAVYLAGNSGSADFPVSARAVQKRNKGNHDGVIVKLEPAR